MGNTFVEATCLKSQVNTGWRGLASGLDFLETVEKLIIAFEAKI